MPTFADDVLPNSPGQNLGSPSQPWDISVRNLTVSGNIFGTIFPTGNGNATAIQGTGVSSQDPSNGNVLQLIGGVWTPSTPVFQGNATQIQGVSVSPQGPVSGQVLGYNGTNWIPTANSANATQIQGRNVLNSSPADQQVLVWIAANNRYEPANQSGSGGGGASLGFVTTSFSATPTFTPSPVGSCTFQITLTGNVTSSTFTSAGLSAGSLFKWIIVQDGAGSRTFTWPSQCATTPFIGTTAGQTTVQSFIWNGSSLIPDGLELIYP